MFKPIIENFGVLRSLLLLTIAILIVTAFFADGRMHMHDWRLFPSIIAPTIMMMLVFVVPLDVTMSFVFMSDASAQEKKRLLRVVKVELIALVAMLLAWLPFMLKVLDI